MNKLLAEVKEIRARARLPMKPTFAEVWRHPKAVLKWWREPALELRNHDGSRYLTRWVLWRAEDKSKRVFLHRMSGPDPDWHLHNHPWPEAKSLVLWGGYAEFRADPCGLGRVRTWTYSVRAGAWNYLPSVHYHRIVALFGRTTWTLFVAGARSRDWGFLVDGKHVPWRTYLNLPDAAELDD